MKRHSDEHEIKLLIQQYFDALYCCDEKLLGQVLHKKALYACIEDDRLLCRDMKTYLPIVSQRISAQSRGENRQDKIVFIDISGPETAFVKANCAIGNRYYTDYLSLLKNDNCWKIISKVFHFDIIPN